MILLVHRAALLMISVLLSMAVSGCEQSEQAKKVRLAPQAPLIHQPPATAPQAQPALVFGFDLRLGPKEDVRIYAPFLKYLEEETGHRFAIRFTKGYGETVDALGRREIQFAAMGPVNCVRAREKYGAGCLVMGLNAEKRAEYRSIIVTRRGSAIKSLQELQGKTFAFGNKYSTQGHLLPRNMLEQAGIALHDLADYTFTDSHAETARLVINGRYDVGGLQDTLARRLEAEGKVRILAVSEPSPSSLICYGKGVDPALLASLKSALLAFDPAGKDAARLIDWEHTEMSRGFVDINESALARIRQLVRRYDLFKP
ncbi:phosphate/phosphite/phosphonate ABC transporter substrate-binding protein [Geobacter sp. SVR]|uniref:phosphate/phosphite/phosphonate ABC transporter substrate-binding protein n=1 Tax=Geobacter sp. SVR TaxID=2495594 RepID=UPI00143F01BE|nr:phosphate/phosphite/phosphonate ABC transporter substrate-binding protein [Geobacter sp. SVR]BCS51968.1 hypothetical protein GSVR_02760 [Geobacter sp. SVR]GCF87217.1 hypothetical protein GSbR_38170 [Geobacter sp. SVR]